MSLLILLSLSSRIVLSTDNFVVDRLADNDSPNADANENANDVRHHGVMEFDTHGSR